MHEIGLVPKKRISTINKHKKQLESELNVKISISKEGELEIIGEGIELWTAKRVLTAIARGFEPETAVFLKESEFGLEIIEVTDYATSKNSIMRLKGRIIGEKGYSKSKIEQLTGTYISVQGKFVGIIGHFNNLDLARKAVTMLLEGRMHSTVFRFLEKERRRKKLKRGFI